MKRKYSITFCSLNKQSAGSRRTKWCGLINADDIRKKLPRIFRTEAKKTDAHLVIARNSYLMLVASKTEFGGEVQFRWVARWTLDGRDNTGDNIIGYNKNEQEQSLRNHSLTRKAMIKCWFYFLTLTLKDIEGDDDDSIYLLIMWRGEICELQVDFDVPSLQTMFVWLCSCVSAAITGNGKINYQRTRYTLWLLLRLSFSIPFIFFFFFSFILCQSFHKFQ